MTTTRKRLPQRAAGPDTKGLTPVRRKEKNAKQRGPLLEKKGQTKGKGEGTEQHHP